MDKRILAVNGVTVTVTSDLFTEAKAQFTGVMPILPMTASSLDPQEQEELDIISNLKESRRLTDGSEFGPWATFTVQNGQIGIILANNQH